MATTVLRRGHANSQSTTCPRQRIDADMAPDLDVVISRQNPRNGWAAASLPASISSTVGLPVIAFLMAIFVAS